MVRTWVDWLLDLPWIDPPAETLDIERAAAILDEDHYGLTKVKDRVLEWLAVRDRIRVKAATGERRRPRGRSGRCAADARANQECRAGSVPAPKRPPQEAGGG